MQRAHKSMKQCSPVHEETVHVKPGAEMLGLTRGLSRTPAAIPGAGTRFFLDSWVCPRDELRTVNCTFFIIPRSQKQPRCPSVRSLVSIQWNTAHWENKWNPPQYIPWSDLLLNENNSHPKPSDSAAFHVTRREMRVPLCVHMCVRTLSFPCMFKEKPWESKD